MNSDSEQELWGSGESISGDQTWSNPVSAQVTPDNNSRKGGCGCDIGVSAGASVEVLKVSRLVMIGTILEGFRGLREVSAIGQSGFTWI